MSGSFEHIEAGSRQQTANLLFLQELHRRGAPLDRRDLDILFKADIITEQELEHQASKEEQEKTADELDRYILTTDLYREKCDKAGFVDKWKDRDIFRTDWKCDEPAQFDEETIKLIDSHHVRFCDLIAHEKFYLYQEQSDRWMQDPEPDLEAMDLYERRAYYRQEYRRIRTNTLYALDRYGWYKESSLPGGEGKYVATIAMRFILFLFDDGRSMYIGKGRQITSTTTLALAGNVKMIAYRNFHAKLIACDLDTTEEIFEDKVKYGFSRFKRWMKPKVGNDSDKVFRVLFNSSESKGSRKGVTSKTSVVAPKLSAINGGAPDIVLVDEAPFLDIFHGMVKEGRPTMFATKDGKLRMLRQLIAWGTGGRSAKGGGSFEREHRGLFAKWMARDFSEGIIPIFLDWTCRPNITVAHYLSEKKSYMAGSIDGHDHTSIEDREILFRQHYPSSIDDMYSIGSATLVPISFIIKQSDKITKLPHDLRPVYGYFKEIYGTVKSPDESFFPYEVVGSEFIRLGEFDVNAPVTMFMEPRKGENLYYQYTDPIVNDEGYSRHASAIRDAEYRTIACLVNTRFDDPYKAYSQSKLMGMYYRNTGSEQRFCPELIENNIGKAYIKWLCGPEWKARQSLVTNMMLPDMLQGGGDDIGIDTKDIRKRLVVEIGKNDLLTNGKNYYIPQLWSQLKFFTGTTGKNGKTLWGVDDRKKHQDDVVDAVFGSAVCRMCFASRTPLTYGDGERPARVEQDEDTHTLIFDRSTGKVRRVSAGEVENDRERERMRYERHHHYGAIEHH